MRHRRNTKKRGTQPFFCRPAWFLRTQQSALQWGGGKTVCGHQAWSPSFSGVHPIPIPRPRPPFPRYYCVNAQSNPSSRARRFRRDGNPECVSPVPRPREPSPDSMLQPSWGGRGRRGGPSPEGSLLSPSSSLGGCVRSVAVRSPALSQWRTIQNSRGGVGKRHVFGTRFPV